MKILYGVQGTGNGHIARARVMAKALAKRVDIDVDFVFTGRHPDQYFDMGVFGQYRTFDGLTFITRKGRVDKWQTIKQAKVRQFVRDIRSLDLSQYDLLLNDFEPVTAWAAKLHGLDAISVSHQAAFKHAVPKQGETLADRLLMRIFAPSDIYLGVHWYHFGYPIMPPFIEENVQHSRCGEQILVYLPFEDVTEIEVLLSHFPNQSFVCFHPEVRTQSQKRHIQWCPPSKSKFQQALLASSGVIANGGFELSSECLQLGKKLLIKPLLGQYEQSSNRVTLERLNRCLSMDKLDPTVVAKWLTVEAPAPITFPSDPDIFIDWLLEENWFDTQGLCNQLWKQVRFPMDVQNQLKHFGHIRSGVV